MSKFLSYVLRHQPDSIGIQLDEQGWVGVEELLDAAARAGKPFTRAQLEKVVANSDKQRFALDAASDRIRANQGHSVAVDLGLEPRQPPEQLYHGTAAASVASIRRDGLHSGNRQHVHLSLDVATAVKVGTRHGNPVVLTVHAGDSWRAGGAFFLSANGVWLTESVPPRFIGFPDP